MRKRALANLLEFSWGQFFCASLVPLGISPVVVVVVSFVIFLFSFVAATELDEPHRHPLTLTCSLAGVQEELFPLCSVLPLPAESSRLNINATLSPTPRRQVSYSFEIVAARLVRPPKRPPDARSGRCRNKCSPGKACPCNHDSPARSRRLAEDVKPPGKTEVAVSVPAGDGEGQEGEAGGGGEGGGVHPHHSLNMGVNDVATLVLEDNQGITYDFYTFQVGWIFINVARTAVYSVPVR